MVEDLEKQKVENYLRSNGFSEKDITMMLSNSACFKAVSSQIHLTEQGIEKLNSKSPIQKSIKSGENLFRRCK